MTSEMPDHSELSACLDYNPGTGALTWKTRPRSTFKSDHACKSWNSRYQNTPAFTAKLPARVGGYLHGSYKKRGYKAHRMAWFLFYGLLPEKGLAIDHINGDPADNRIANLRAVTQSENCRNAKLRRTNKSGVPGVFWHKSIDRWVATVCCENRRKHLGVFHTLEEAIAVRLAANREYGFHENHGRALAAIHGEAGK